MTRIAAVVLAAGESTRFGEPKQRLLLPYVIERLRGSPVDEIVVVEGAHELERTELALGGPPVRIVTADDWADGPGASLRVGLSSLDDDVAAAVVVLADGPGLSPQAVERVLGAWRTDGGVAAASYAGARGHPLVVGRRDWGDVPDAGLHERPAQLVPCDDLGAPGDVDTQADLPSGRPPGWQL